MPDKTEEESRRLIFKTLSDHYRKEILKEEARRARGCKCLRMTNLPSMSKDRFEEDMARNCLTRVYKVRSIPGGFEFEVGNEEDERAVLNCDGMPWGRGRPTVRVSRFERKMSESDIFRAVAEQVAIYEEADRIREESSQPKPPKFDGNKPKWGGFNQIRSVETKGGGPALATPPEGIPKRGGGVHPHPG